MIVINTLCTCCFMPYAHTRITEDSCIYSENPASILVGKTEKAICTRTSFQTVTYSHTLHLVAPLVSLRHDPILTDDVILKEKNSQSCWKVTQQDFHKSKAVLLLCSAKVTVAY